MFSVTREVISVCSLAAIHPVHCFPLNHIHHGFGHPAIASTKMLVGSFYCITTNLGWTGWGYKIFGRCMIHQFYQLNFRQLASETGMAPTPEYGALRFRVPKGEKGMRIIALLIFPAANTKIVSILFARICLLFIFPLGVTVSI